jgi:hypothetical protein
MSLLTAEQIYHRAFLRAQKDHKRMVHKFMRGEIPIASPCGMDRERQYIIEDFQKALDRAFSPADRT